MGIKAYWKPGAKYCCKVHTETRKDLVATHCGDTSMPTASQCRTNYVDLQQRISELELENTALKDEVALEKRKYHNEMRTLRNQADKKLGWKKIA